MKIKPSQLKIGENLYQYSSKIMPYIIKGINELKTEGHTEKFYVLECQNCIDHPKCEIAVKFDDYGDLVYSHMINGYDEYDEDYHERHSHYSNGQYYWHRNKEYKWFLTMKEARLWLYDKYINDYKKSIEDKENIIDGIKKQIEELEEKKQTIIDTEDELNNINNNKE